MKGYAKIKENNPFFQRLNSKKENPFLDQNFHNDQQVLGNHFDKFSSNFSNKKTPKNDDQKPNNIINNNNKNDLFVGKSDDLENGEEIISKKGAILRRNFSVSSSGYQKNCSNNNNAEKVKRVFSMRRSSSVNHNKSDRYSRIYDQPQNNDDDDDDDEDYTSANNNNNNNCNSNYDYVDCNYDYERNGSMETRSMKKSEFFSGKNGKMHVGCSKVVKACKRIFSR